MKATGHVGGSIDLDAECRCCGSASSKIVKRELAECKSAGLMRSWAWIGGRV